MSEVEFSAIKDELKRIKEELPWTKLNEKFWKQVFGKDWFNGENLAKLQFNLN
jgi:hypothetical protein